MHEQLVGPWIEAVGADLFRVSPLASTFGRETLTLDEQTAIHETIAVQMLRKRKIYAGDADAIMMHAIAGKSARSLAILAKGVLTADFRTLEKLAEHLRFLPLLQTDAPIFPENTSISAMLRIAQFKLLAAAGNGGRAVNVAAALFNEIGRMPPGQLRHATEVMALVSVLSTMGIANYLDDWINLIHRFKTMVEADSFLRGLETMFEAKAPLPGVGLFSVLFSIGSTPLASVERLEHVIDELNKLDATERALWLTPVVKGFTDYSVLINGPWTSQQRREPANWRDAAIRYQRIAEKTENWGIG